MTAFGLFHESTFREKCINIMAPAQIHALLASMLAFSARFCAPAGHEGLNLNENGLARMQRSPSYFLDLASEFANEAMSECEDEPPDMCLLQALILVTHGHLVHGVHGRAWRSLGVCVRIAYELNLHLCDFEEKRRAWWAIWEMEVFASTVRRCPMGLDWSQMETLLPFIAINSLMKEAQIISSPRNISAARCNKDPKLALAAAATQGRLETLSNCVRCFKMALPPPLKYQNQFLGFDPHQSGNLSSPRQEQCGIYNIHVMAQLARLMICHYNIFAEPTLRESLAIHQYFEATDEILGIINRSSDDHIKHVNAFLASTIWLASAVQLVCKEFGPLGTNAVLVGSKFDVLNMTYKKFVYFWNIHCSFLHCDMKRVATKSMNTSYSSSGGGNRVFR
ncbi:hypothetical protein DL95DRAFT_478529 [Leptodontidium sp. 2 PMI_412]|nr:hypothetical protein DL95DRAFT_478529 [Leptodontidium sp. 2 PMI_412]